MIEAAEAALSPQQPWPGMRPYWERDADYFFGRDAEVADLLARTERSLLTLLYARGGLGKTSLLHAGLIPRLAGRGYLPVYLRPRALFEGGRDPIAEVIRSIKAAAAEGDIEATAEFAAPTLWEFFHRASLDLWDKTNRLVTPVLIFDQFEEVFHVIDDDASATPRAKELLDNLSELIENRMPAHLATSDSPADEDQRFVIASKAYRVILSFREDYLPQVRKLRTIVPSVVENHVRLEAFSGEQALDVLKKAGRNLIDYDAATMLIRGVGRRAGPLQMLLDPDVSAAGESDRSVANLEVEPAILSVVCFALNTERLSRAQKTIDADLVSRKKPEDIFDNYYRTAIAQVSSEARRFVESSLVTRGGERVLHPMKAIERKGPALTGAISRLIDQGILRKEWLAGEQHLEISHDLLLRPIRFLAERRLRQRHLLIAVVSVAAIFALAKLYHTHEVNVELDQRQNLNEQLLVAYAPKGAEDEMLRLVEVANNAAGGAPGVEALQTLVDWTVDIAAPIDDKTAHRLRRFAVDFVQLKIDRGRISVSGAETLLRNLRAIVGQACGKGYMQSGDRLAKWFVDKGGVPVECQ